MKSFSVPWVMVCYAKDDSTWRHTYNKMAEEDGTSSVNKWELQELQFSGQFERNKEKGEVLSKMWSGFGRTSRTASAALGGQQCRTLLKAQPENLTCNGWRAASYDLEDVLRWPIVTTWPIVSRTHIVPIIPLRWVSNGSKHKHTALCYGVTWARWPFAKIVIANDVLLKSEVRRGQKSVICRLPCGALNAQRNATHRMPHNTVVKSFPYSSLLEQREKKNWKIKTKGWKCLEHFSRVGACSHESIVSAVWYEVRTFCSPVLVAAFKPYRTLALLFHWDTNNHHHPYIDSTTMLSDST